MRKLDKKHRSAFLIFLFVVCLFSFQIHSSPLPPTLPPVNLVYPAIQGTLFQNYDVPGSELREKGRDLRGVYIPMTKIVDTRERKLVQWIHEKVGASAVIIDIKDDRGRVTFTRNIPGANSRAHGFVPKLASIVNELKKRDVYVIGRLVCFKDNHFPRVRPVAAIRDKRTRKIWRDRTNMSWLDPYSTTAHKYIASIAVAAEKIGFDEIQLDYVRFPVEAKTRYAIYPNRKNELKRYSAIASLLSRVDDAVDLPLSIDVFGLTAYKSADSERLGQSLEHLAPYIDAISPMLYIANFPPSYWSNPKPSRNRSLVHKAVKHIRRRLGDHIAVRPLLQAFAYRAPNFGVPFLLNQVKGAKTAGSSGYLFWNQNGHYGKVAAIWRGKTKVRESNRYKPHILVPHKY